MSPLTVCAFERRQKQSPSTTEAHRITAELLKIGKSVHLERLGIVKLFAGGLSLITLALDTLTL